MSQTIETLFADLCDIHDLTTLSVGYTGSVYPAHRWLSYVHWTAGACASGYGSTAHEAIEVALKDAAAKRSVHITVPSAIVMGEAA